MRVVEWGVRVSLMHVRWREPAAFRDFGDEEILGQTRRHEEKPADAGFMERMVE